MNTKAEKIESTLRAAKRSTCKAAAPQWTAEQRADSRTTRVGPVRRMLRSPLRSSGPQSGPPEGRLLRSPRRICRLTGGEPGSLWSERALYTFSIPEPWFGLVFSGKKTIYGTLFSKKLSDIKNKDIIIFENNEFGLNRSIRVKVNGKCKIYNNFKDMLENVDGDKSMPNIDGVENKLRLYNKIYKINAQNKHGVIAIPIKLSS